MRELLSQLQDWIGSGEPVALATVVNATGSSPRPVGSVMAATRSGQMAGSVSGGCVEGTVLYEVQEVLDTANAKLLEYGVVDQDGWEVGLACGGTIQVYVEPLAPIHKRLIEALAGDDVLALVTHLGGGGHLLVWPDGRSEGEVALLSGLDWGADPYAEPWAARQMTPAGTVFVQVFGPPPTLTVVGAVHLAQPLVALAQLMGFRVRVVDGRRAFATRERFPTADELIVAWPQEALGPEHLRPRDAIAILTHDSKFDVPALEIALRSPVGYVGMLGSAATQTERREELYELGFSEHDLARIHGPIGFDLGGDEPEEIALAIMAEIVAVRHGILNRGSDFPTRGADAGG